MKNKLYNLVCTKCGHTRELEDGTECPVIGTISETFDELLSSEFLCSCSNVRCCNIVAKLEERKDISSLT